MKTVSWFSSGVSSAVATKLVIDDVDEILYIHIDDQHEDSMRFVRECEEWFGKEIKIIQSIYKTVEEACLAAGGRGYLNGISGAACTKMLKKRVRVEWEAHQGALRYVWGMDCSTGEKARAERLLDTMPDQEHIFPLIEKSISKEHAHEILQASGIKRPLLYDMGYHNNNCVGCIKGGAGYWNKIRADFPDVFRQRAELERKIKGSCLHDSNGPIYLDELDETRAAMTGRLSATAAYCAS